MKLAELFVCAACPTSGGDWSLLLWLNDGQRSWWARHNSPHLMSKIHTIPVPYGWSTEQAWEAISRGDELPDEGESWANVETDDNDKFVRVLPKESDA